MAGPLMSRRAVVGGGASILAGSARSARAQSAPIRIGVLTDQTGPYADSGGPGSVLAAEMAAAEARAASPGLTVEILHGDTQNKADVAATLARRWYDDGVDAIVDLPVTPVAAAVQQIAREKGRTVMITAAAATELTSKTCSPVSTHWADDTHALSTGAATPIVAAGGKDWFFITVDMAFGQALERESAAIIKAGGGRVLGSVRFPLGTTDFAASILQAQSSGAGVIGLASVGTELVNLIKQAGEFGLQRGGTPTLVGFLIYIVEIHALGLQVAQGFTFPSGFYWNQNETARAWSRQFFSTRKAMPTRVHAGVYTATRHFLRAVTQSGSGDPLVVNQAMRQMPVDYLGRPAWFRADGRLLYDLTVYRVRAPDAVSEPWDYYDAVTTLPAAAAFASAADGCG